MSSSSQSGQKRVTSSQVAARAGVSRTTVSFVLNGVPASGISDDTRTRVLLAARELGYVPNAAARSLVSGNSHTVALVIPHNEHIRVDAFIPGLLGAINRHCHARGFMVLLESVEDVTVPGAYLRLVDSRRIDGLIMLNPRQQEDPHLLELARNRFPLVLFGSGPGMQPDMCGISTDNRAAARGATAHLLALGHRRIAHLSFASFDYQVALARWEGYRDALAEHGLEADPALLAHGDFSAASGYQAARELLRRPLRPTALFAGNDIMAFGAMRAIREHGLRIPEDIAVVGFDDMVLAEFADPPLTTVRTDPVVQGALGAEMLLQLIRGSAPAQRHVVMDTELIVRASCGAATYI